jgi:hypothetical protein
MLSPSKKSHLHQQIIDALSWVLSLKSAFNAMIEFIDAEHEHIRNANLAGLEVVGAQKAEVGTEIEMSVKAIREMQSELSKEYSVELSDVEVPENLSGLMVVFSRMIEVKGLRGSRETERDLNTLEEAIEECLAMRQEYAPKLQQNKYLVERMLHIHQENYRFWQGVINESEATYTPYGARKGDARNSLLKVQA